MPRKKARFLTEEDIQDIRCHVRRAIRKKLLNESDKEDMEQELIIHLLKGVDKYQKTRSNWNTYRGLLLRGRMRELIRLKLQPTSYEQRKASFSIDDPVPSEFGESDYLLWRDIINQDGVFADGTERGDEYDRLDIILDVRDAIRDMPRHLQRLSYLLMMADGLSKPELGQRLHVSTRTVFYWFGELKMFLSQRGLGARV